MPSPARLILARPSRRATARSAPASPAYRAENAGRHADWFNGAVPSFGDPEARLLVLGLAPGVAGANRTGRPFTGDYAGDLLYATLTRSASPTAASPPTPTTASRSATA